MNIIQSEKGFVLILTMVMLATLSILGVMVLNTTNVELNITTNSRLNSNAFIASELVTEYAKQQVVNSPSAIGSNYDLVNDGALAAIIPAGLSLPDVDGHNEIVHYTGQAPTIMASQTSTDAYLSNIYRTGNDSGASASGEAAFYRISVNVEGQRGASARVDTLFVNRGGQVF